MDATPFTTIKRKSKLGNLTTHTPKKPDTSVPMVKHMDDRPNIASKKSKLLRAVSSFSMNRLQGGGMIRQ